jgi:hypothetical protein
VGAGQSLIKKHGVDHISGVTRSGVPFGYRKNASPLAKPRPEWAYHPHDVEDRIVEFQQAQDEPLEYPQYYKPGTLYEGETVEVLDSLGLEEGYKEIKNG